MIEKQKPPARDQGRRDVACRAGGHTARQAHEIWRYCSATKWSWSTDLFTESVKFASAKPHDIPCWIVLI